MRGFFYPDAREVVTSLGEPLCGAEVRGLRDQMMPLVKGGTVEAVFWEVGSAEDSPGSTEGGEEATGQDGGFRVASVRYRARHAGDTARVSTIPGVASR